MGFVALVELIGDLELPSVVHTINLDARVLLPEFVDRSDQRLFNVGSVCTFNQLHVEGRLVVLLLALTDHKVDLGADRKTTRLNSSHVAISYDVICLKKERFGLLMKWRTTS